MRRGSRFFYPEPYTRATGVSRRARLEITPAEPDPGHAGEGRSDRGESTEPGASRRFRSGCGRSAGSRTGCCGAASASACSSSSPAPSSSPRSRCPRRCSRSSSAGSSATPCSAARRRSARRRACRRWSCCAPRSAAPARTSRPGSTSCRTSAGRSSRCSSSPPPPRRSCTGRSGSGSSRPRRQRRSSRSLGPIGFVRVWVKRVALWVVLASLVYLTWWTLHDARPRRALVAAGQGRARASGRESTCGRDAGLLAPARRRLHALLEEQPRRVLGIRRRLLHPERVALRARRDPAAHARPRGCALGDRARSRPAALGAALALVALGVDETKEPFANIYSAAVSLQNVLPRVPQRLLILAVAPSRPRARS